MELSVENTSVLRGPPALLAPEQAEDTAEVEKMDGRMLGEAGMWWKKSVQMWMVKG